MARVSYLTVGPASRPRQIVECVANAMLGKLNVGGETTLNGIETVIFDPRIGAQSLLLFMPVAEAGVAVVSGIWIKVRENGKAVIGHPAATGERADYVVIG